MKKSAFFVLAAVAVLLTRTASANQYVASPSLVTPGDTFSFDLLGYNSTSGNGYFIGEGVATFGVTSTYTGIDGNVLTVISSETILGNTVVDTFSISTPSNFITETTLNGITITGIEFDLGNANSGAANGLAAGNTVDTLLPLTGISSMGSVLYNANTKQTLGPGTTLSNGNRSYAAVEGLQAGTSAINQFNVRTFTYSIEYANVPEPSTWALGALGMAGCAGVVFRRRRARS